MSSDRSKPSNANFAKSKDPRRVGRALLSAVIFAALIITELVGTHGTIRWLLLAVVITAGITTWFIYAVLPGRIRSRDALWSSYGYIDIFVIENLGLGESLRLAGYRRIRYWTQGRGLAGGRFEVTKNGLRWSFGYVARLAGITGRLDIPFRDIRTISPVPFRRGLNRNHSEFKIVLKDGREFNAYFIGSGEAFAKAIVPLLTA
jgi:hypothetical protein